VGECTVFGFIPGSRKGRFVTFLALLRLLNHDGALVRVVQCRTTTDTSECWPLAKRTSVREYDAVFIVYYDVL
jgi:hypothetical protein